MYTHVLIGMLNRPFDYDWVSLILWVHKNNKWHHDKNTYESYDYHDKKNLSQLFSKPKTTAYCVVLRIEFSSRWQWLWLHRTKRPLPTAPKRTLLPAAAKKNESQKTEEKKRARALTAQCTCTKIAFSLMLFLIISTRQNIFFSFLVFRALFSALEMNLNHSFTTPSALFFLCVCKFMHIACAAYCKHHHHTLSTHNSLKFA